MKGLHLYIPAAAFSFFFLRYFDDIFLKTQWTLSCSLQWLKHEAISKMSKELRFL